MTKNNINKDKRFEFLEHTADTKIRAYGSSLEEAFCNVVIATTEVMISLNAIKKNSSKEVYVSAGDEKSLLYDFLDEILYLFDVEGFLVREVKDLKILRSETLELSCLLVGDFLSNGYEVHTIIKSVTYSEMEIIEEEGLFVIQVVHDL